MTIPDPSWADLFIFGIRWSVVATGFLAGLAAIAVSIGLVCAAGAFLGLWLRDLILRLTRKRPVDPLAPPRKEARIWSKLRSDESGEAI